MPAKLDWKEAARADLLAIVEYVSDYNPDAAQRLKTEIEAKASRLLNRPKLYRAGRVAGTREMSVRPSYVVVYSENDEAVTILRVLHTARQWPLESKKEGG